MNQKQNVDTGKQIGGGTFNEMRGFAFIFPTPTKMTTLIHVNELLYTYLYLSPV